MSDKSNFNSASLEDDYAIDFASILGAIWRARFLLIGGALICAVLLFLLGKMLTPQFRSQAQVFVESQNVQVTRSGNEQGQVEQTRAALDPEGVASVARLIASPDNALEVIRDLNLTENAEFNTALKPSGFDSVLTLLGLKNSTDQMVEERTVQVFLEKLNVSPVQQSRIISVTFSTADRQLAADIPNAIVENFLRSNSGVQGSANEATVEVLSDQIERLRAELEVAEIATAEFRSSAALEVTGGAGSTSIATQQLSDISTQLSQVRSERASAQAKADEIKRILGSGGSIDTVTDVQTSPLIQRLAESQAAIRAEIAQLSSSLLPTHPRIQSLQSQLGDLDNEIQRQAQNIVASLENQVNILNNNEDELTVEFNKLRATAAEAETSSAKLNRFEGEAASLRELLSTYQARYNQAISRNSGTASSINARIAARALVPLNAYFPKTLLMAFAGMAAWLLLAGLGVIAKALLSGDAMRSAPRSMSSAPAMQPPTSSPPTSSHSASSASQDAHNPIFGGFSEQNAYNFQNVSTSYEAKIEPKKNSIQLAEDPVIEQSNLAAQAPEEVIQVSEVEEIVEEPEALINFFSVGELTNLLSNEDSRRVLLVSPQGEAAIGGGIQLARALSASSRSTILIDFSGTWTGISARLGFADQFGITDLLAQKAGFGQIIQQDKSSNLHVVPAGMTSLEEVGTAYRRSSMVLDAFQSNYDFAIVDCGQALPENIVEMACEGAIAVLCVNNAPSEMLSNYVERLQEHGFGSVPIVELAIDNGAIGSTEQGQRVG